MAVMVFSGEASPELFDGEEASSKNGDNISRERKRKYDV